MFSAAACRTFAWERMQLLVGVSGWRRGEWNLVLICAISRPLPCPKQRAGHAGRSSSRARESACRPAYRRQRDQPLAPSVVGPTGWLCCTPFRLFRVSLFRVNPCVEQPSGPSRGPGLIHPRLNPAPRRCRQPRGAKEKRGIELACCRRLQHGPTGAPHTLRPASLSVLIFCLLLCFFFKLWLGGRANGPTEPGATRAMIQSRFYSSFPLYALLTWARDKR